jgi:4-hydroxyphenylpyruvate dioxygenase
MAIAIEELARVTSHKPETITGFAYIEYYVGNARQAAHFWRTAYGFKPIAYCGLETGVRDRTSIFMLQNDIRVLLTAAVDPHSPIARHVYEHGDDVKDIAFAVEDASAAYEAAVTRGAKPLMPPTVFEDDNGCMIKATISAFGDTVHSFIERNAVSARDGASDAYFPNFEFVRHAPSVVPTGLMQIDHVAVCIEPRKLEEMVGFYSDVLGFHHSHTEDVLTEYSSMNSKVVESRMGQIKFALVEPGAGNRKSQIEEYLSFHDGPGAQHVAFSSHDITATVKALRANGNEFLRVPDTYYQALRSRIGDIDEDIEALRGLNILADRDQWGYLMQIFSKPILDRPTIFTEIIQRKKARGFGGGNIRALFEALEREQALRGNL